MNKNNTDSKSKITNRRSVLSALGAGVAGSIGLAANTETATAGHEVDKQRNIFNKTISVPYTDMEVEHSVSLTTYHGYCEFDEYYRPFDLNVDTIAYEEGNPDNKYDEAIQQNMIELEFPDGTVEGHTDKVEQTGGYLEEKNGDEYTWADDAILFALGELTPHGWVIGGAQVADEMLDWIVEKTDSTDTINRTFMFYNMNRDPIGYRVGQGNGWAAFTAEITPGGWRTIDIKHGFMIDRSLYGYGDPWFYRDTVSKTLGSDSYC